MGVRLIRLPGLEPYFFRTHKDRFDESVSIKIMKRGIWEPLETEIILRLLRLYDTFLDLGANIGWYTALSNRSQPISLFCKKMRDR